MHGDRLLLSTGNGNGDVARFESSVEFGPSDGRSWGRDPDQDGRFTVLVAHVRGTQRIGRSGRRPDYGVNFHPGPVARALQADPTLVADDLEYLEIYNATANSLDLTGWSLGGASTGLLPPRPLWPPARRWLWSGSIRNCPNYPLAWKRSKRTTASIRRYAWWAPTWDTSRMITAK